MWKIDLLLPLYTPLHQVLVNSARVQACPLCVLISRHKVLLLYWGAAVVINDDLIICFQVPELTMWSVQWWPCWPERPGRCQPLRSVIVSLLTVGFSLHILVWKFTKDPPSWRRVGGESYGENSTWYLLPVILPSDFLSYSFIILPCRIQSIRGEWKKWNNSSDVIKLSVAVQCSREPALLNQYNLTCNHSSH